ncbi:MAG: hypothetical protein WCF90_01425 [Methanomicrobiales archaeon]
MIGVPGTRDNDRIVAIDTIRGKTPCGMDAGDPGNRPGWIIFLPDLDPAADSG